MTTEQVSLPSNSCECCACPTLPSTVRSSSAARSRTQRDEGNLHLVPPLNGGRGCQVQRCTAAGTETENNNDC
eukprot:2230663-Prymnesium_polylepis.1